MSDSVYKVVELIGTSMTSWEEAPIRQLRARLKRCVSFE